MGVLINFIIRNYTNHVFNLSNSVLSVKENKVLNKSLKFSPCTSQNEFEIFVYLQKLIREFTLKRCILRTMGEAMEDRNQVIKTSQRVFKKSNKSIFFPKDSQGEYTKILAYKRGGILVQEREDYFREAYRQLGDSFTYKNCFMIPLTITVKN
ncbi:hypothetical protein XELAEV_18012043mg [Xenopus laevis]|uniref:Uncharacterized protein n=1 Tax=Xenopus laevis TaxID=8355 RepID=A0A974DME6_XENLA|nr:hypothetical protein XELAEV_18012043mg [Xenopus laevis]